ncbi:hypothetical protein GCM10020331_090950 [Ectobacillus funiculus]
MKKPEYSYLSWFAMLFSAGMGIGLVFWGVSEPLMHFFIHRPLEKDRMLTVRAWPCVIRFFHWGLHPWGAVCCCGIMYRVLYVPKREAEHHQRDRDFFVQ